MAHPARWPAVALGAGSEVRVPIPGAHRRAVEPETGAPWWKAAAGAVAVSAAEAPGRFAVRVVAPPPDDAPGTHALTGAVAGAGGRWEEREGATCRATDAAAEPRPESLSTLMAQPLMAHQVTVRVEVGPYTIRGRQVATRKECAAE